MKVMRYKLILFLLLFSAYSFSQEANPYIRGGNKLYNKGKYTDAEVKYREGLARDKKSVESTYNLANTLYKQKKYAKAAQEYEKVASLVKSDDSKKVSTIYHNLGNSHFRTEEYAKSIDAYKKALKNNPKDNDTRYNLALAQKKIIQQQNNKNKNQKQDNNKADKDNKKQEKQSPNNQNNQQPPKQKKDELSKENAQQILDAFLQDEKNVQDKVKKQQHNSAKKKLEKDW